MSNNFYFYGQIVNKLQILLLIPIFELNVWVQTTIMTMIYTQTGVKCTPEVVLK